VIAVVDDRATVMLETDAACGQGMRARIRPGHSCRPRADLVELNGDEEIAIGPDCSTSCPGLFAVGGAYLALDLTGEARRHCRAVLEGFPESPETEAARKLLSGMCE
jgi:hypothetical protein